MESIELAYKGKRYEFDYYSTTINLQNIVFLITKDEEASRMLLENHFFITMDISRPGPGIYYNGIKGGREEVEFKNAICKELLKRFVTVS